MLTLSNPEQKQPRQQSRKTQFRLKNIQRFHFEETNCLIIMAIEQKVKLDKMTALMNRNDKLEQKKAKSNINRDNNVFKIESLNKGSTNYFK